MVIAGLDTDSCCMDNEGRILPSSAIEQRWHVKKANTHIQYYYIKGVCIIFDSNIQLLTICLALLVVYEI